MADNWEEKGHRAEPASTHNGLTTQTDLLGSRLQQAFLTLYLYLHTWCTLRFWYAVADYWRRLPPFPKKGRLIESIGGLEVYRAGTQGCFIGSGAIFERIREVLRPEPRPRLMVGMSLHNDSTPCTDMLYARHRANRRNNTASLHLRT